MVGLELSYYIFMGINNLTLFLIRRGKRLLRIFSARGNETEDYVGVILSFFRSMAVSLKEETAFHTAQHASIKTGSERFSPIVSTKSMRSVVHAVHSSTICDVESTSAGRCSPPPYPIRAHHTGTLLGRRACIPAAPPLQDHGDWV